MHHFHAVVWLDHREAKVFEFTADDVAKLVINAEHPAKHIHHKSGSVGPGHAKEDENYYHGVADALAKAGEILIVGPGQAKTALFKHLHAHDREVAAKVAAVETVDHPSDGQIVAYARKYFDRRDRTTAQRV
jgi:stalled ribosome rescue protein Dom34